MTPTELGDALARLVWESFSDDLSDADMRQLFAVLHVRVQDGVPHDRAFEELLIFHLWLHTRAVQLALHDRLGRDRLREVLDAMHGAIFEDMVDNGTPRSQLPLFEQRASTRYSDYYDATRGSGGGVGETAARHLAGTNRKPDPSAARRLAARAVEVTRPLRDFLEDVDVVHEG